MRLDTVLGVVYAQAERDYDGQSRSSCTCVAHAVAYVVCPQVGDDGDGGGDAAASADDADFDGLELPGTVHA